MKKTITLVMTLVLVFVFTTTSFASNLEIGGEKFIVANLSESLAGIKFDLVNKDIFINYDIQQLDTDTIKVNTVVKMGDGTTEKHTGIYNTKTSIFILDGEVTFDLYETSIPIDTGYGSKQYGYRYQDIGANFRIRGFSFNEVYLSKGSTWFASKPY